MQSEKFLEVIGRIINQPELISETYVDGNEVYFRYKGQAMSIMDRRDLDENNGRFTIWFYPQYAGAMAALALALTHGVIEDVPMLPFHSANYNEHNSFGILHQTVLGHHYGIDGVFDGILS